MNAAAKGLALVLPCVLPCGVVVVVPCIVVSVILVEIALLIE